MSTDRCARLGDLDPALGELAAYLEGVVDVVARLAHDASEPLELGNRDHQPVRSGARLLDLEGETRLSALGSEVTTYSASKGGARLVDLEPPRHQETRLSGELRASRLPFVVEPMACAPSNDEVLPVRGGTRLLDLEPIEAPVAISIPPLECLETAAVSLWPESDSDRVSGFRFQVAPAALQTTGTDDE